MRYNTRGGYPGRGYQERRKTKRVLLIILVAIVVAAAVLLGLMAYMAKAKAQQEAAQQEGRLLGITVVPMASLKISYAAEQSLCLSQCYGQLTLAFLPSLPVSLQLPWDSIPPKSVNI